jgi:hypothetical protein
MSQTLSTQLDATARREGTSLGRDVIAGALSGQIAGLVMAVVVMAVFTIFLGEGPLVPVQVIGSFVFGDSALQGFQPGAFVAGLLLHQLGPALFWGSLFGVAVNKLDLRGGAPLLALGAVTGLASQIVDVQLLMPVLMKALHGHDLWAEHVPAFWSWAAHLVFGLALGVFPWVATRVDRRV